MNTIESNEDTLTTINLVVEYPTIKRIGIFGSYASGENDKSSDLDIMYDYDIEVECSTD